MAKSDGVTGIVFFDTNGNGIRERDEPGFAGIVVTLFGTKADGSSLYLTTRTDSHGNFAFPGSSSVGRAAIRCRQAARPLAAVIPTTYHPTRTFFTATDGNDSNPGTRSQPFRTIGHAVPLLEAGDLLFIRQGEYREYVSTVSSPLGGGSGWDRPIVVAGMPGETVVIRPPDRQGSEPLINLSFPRQQYLVFDNLVLDAQDATLPLRSQSRDGKDSLPNHIRLINCELANSKGSAVFLAGEDHQFINCRIHDNGHSSKDHGLHVGGGKNIIHGCDIYHNFGSGIYLYSDFQETASNNVIRGNRIHDNGPSDGTSSEAPGIALNTGRKNLLYDNVIWGNPCGIVVDNQGCEERIFNNTVCGNRGPGIAIGKDKETHDNEVRNNILFRNREPNLLNLSKTTTADHNTVDSNPHFREPAINDFHLQADSPAIDTGVKIPEVRSDHDGIPRPQGKEYDRGAYEYSNDSFVPTAGLHSSFIYSGPTHPIYIGFTRRTESTRETRP